MLRYGKHRGVSFADVLKNDRPYCAWVIKVPGLPQWLKSFRKFMLHHAGGIIEIGMHRLSTYHEIYTKQAEYCDWAVALPDPNSGMKEFVNYVVLRRAVEAEDEETVDDAEPPPKKARTKDRVCTSECHICMSEPINSVLIPCGHLAACLSCARRCEGKRCPICRELVLVVLQTFAA